MTRVIKAWLQNAKTSTSGACLSVPVITFFYKSQRSSCVFGTSQASLMQNESNRTHKNCRYFVMLCAQVSLITTSSSSIIRSFVFAQAEVNWSFRRTSCASTYAVRMSETFRSSICRVWFRLSKRRKTNDSSKPYRYTMYSCWVPWNSLDPSGNVFPRVVYCERAAIFTQRSPCVGRHVCCWHDIACARRHAPNAVLLSW